VRLDVTEPTIFREAVAHPEELFGEHHIRTFLSNPELVRRMGLLHDQGLVGSPANDTAEFVIQQCATGASAVYRGLQRMQGPIRDVCAALVGERWPAVHSVAFQTPAGIQACKMHFDPFVTLVIHTRTAADANRKAWTIYEPCPDGVDLGVDRTGVRDGVLTSAEEQYYAAQKPFLQAILYPGDAMLVPGGLAALCGRWRDVVPAF